MAIGETDDANAGSNQNVQVGQAVTFNGLAAPTTLASRATSGISVMVAQALGSHLRTRTQALELTP